MKKLFYVFLIFSNQVISQSINEVLLLPGAAIYSDTLNLLDQSAFITAKIATIKSNKYNSDWVQVYYQNEELSTIAGFVIRNQTSSIYLRKTDKFIALLPSLVFKQEFLDVNSIIYTIVEIEKNKTKEIAKIETFETSHMEINVKPQTTDNIDLAFTLKMTCSMLCISDIENYIFWRTREDEKLHHHKIQYHNSDYGEPEYTYKLENETFGEKGKITVIKSEFKFDINSLLDTRDQIISVIDTIDME